MSLWTTLGRVGAYAGAPFTGGASLAALPVMSYIDSKQAANKAAKASAAGSTGSTNYSNPGDVLSYMGNTGQSYINDLRNRLGTQTSGLSDRFNTAANNVSSASPIAYNPSNQSFGAYSGYKNFADTGGYSEQDQQNIRARAAAPIRATYANAQDDLRRRNVLAGGNLANAAASKAKMTRELSYNLGDQSLNTEAALADAIRSGKLAGLSGMTGIDTSKMSEGLANAGQNLNAQGMESGRLFNNANMFGNQMLNSSSQGIQAEQLQQQLLQAILSGALGKSAQPSGLDKGLGTTASILNLLGQGASIYDSFGKGGGGLFGGGSPGDVGPYQS